MKLSHILVLLTLSSASAVAFADESSTVLNTNANYINRNAYLQDPYINLTSGGGTKIISESATANQSLSQRLFEDGTWNIFGSTIAQYNTSGGNGNPWYGYNANLFAQTGQIGGFSAGGMFVMANPLWSKDLNGRNPVPNNGLPSGEEVNPAEAFLEYQYSNIIQADAGWIAINNSPWLTSSYYSGNLAPSTTYQGAEVSVYPGSGWLLSALAFNSAQIIGQTGFSRLTLYNNTYSPSNPLNTTDSNVSNYTVATGANYSGWNNNYNLRLWAYDFQNYGNLLYGDTGLKFHPTNNIGFNVAMQGGVDRANIEPNNVFTSNNLGQINSNFVGLAAGFTDEWFSLNIGYNNVWGDSNALGQGGIVSPYTNGLATDPLYTTPVMMGLVDMGTSGQAFKISPSFNFMNGSLSITPSYSKFYTASAAWNGTSEYDLVANYSIPEVKGLDFFLEYAYQSVPDTSVLPSSSIILAQVSYLY